MSNSEIRKYRVSCDSCGTPLGFYLDFDPSPTIYCYGCESAVTHKEEMKRESADRYKRAVRHS